MSTIARWVSQTWLKVLIFQADNQENVFLEQLPFIIRTSKGVNTASSTDKDSKRNVSTDKGMYYYIEGSKASTNTKFKSQ